MEVLLCKIPLLTVGTLLMFCHSLKGTFVLLIFPESPSWTIVIPSPLVSHHRKTSFITTLTLNIFITFNAVDYFHLSNETPTSTPTKIVFVPQENVCFHLSHPVVDKNHGPATSSPVGHSPTQRFRECTTRSHDSVKGRPHPLKSSVVTPLRLRRRCRGR